MIYSTSTSRLRAKIQVNQVDDGNHQSFGGSSPNDENEDGEKEVYNSQSSLHNYSLELHWSSTTIPLTQLNSKPRRQVITHSSTREQFLFEFRNSSSFENERVPPLHCGLLFGVGTWVILGAIRELPPAVPTVMSLTTSGAKLHVCIALTVFWGGSRYVGRFGRLDAIDALGYDGPRTHNSSWRMNQGVLAISMPIPIPI